MAGDVAGAEVALQEAFAFVEQSDERFWLPDQHGVGGGIALTRSEPDRARGEVCFLKAVQSSRGRSSLPARTARRGRPRATLARHKLTE